MTFARADNRRGLSFDREEPAPQHIAWKSDAPGLVEIWDPIGPDNKVAPSDWRLPLDYVASNDPAALCARTVAKKVKRLLDEAEGEWVEGEDGPRPIDPGDILILVRNRDVFFEAVIRALKEEHVPVAGADRLDLASHIAVMDLCALGRAALLPQDDLTLATLLKSPLMGLDDDDLIALAPRREGALIDALRQSPRIFASGGYPPDRRMAPSGDASFALRFLCAGARRRGRTQAPRLATGVRGQ